MNTDNKNILLKVKNGDFDSFRAFYDNHYKYVFRMGMIVTRNNQEQALKITTDVFTSLWSQKHTLDPNLSAEENIKAHALKIMSDALKNGIKQAKNELFKK